VKFTPNSVKKVSALTEEIIGTTNYDLQSNSSVGDRIVVNNDGTIAAVWTFASNTGTGQSPAYADRGTGYNYYNGSSWGAQPTAKVEGTRVGWGNIVNTRSGKELILSHDGTAGIEKLNLASRATKGQGSWSNSNTAIANVPGGNWWPRMVTSSPSGGDTIYALSISYPVANGGSLYQGLDGAILFSRSTNGGVTWDITNQVPTGLSSTNYIGFAGDGYAIAAKGATVAVVAGDSDKDVVLCKSTDGGVTWTSKLVYKFPLTRWDATTTSSDIHGDGIPDRIESNDGNFAVALDNNNKAFVAYGRMRVICETPSANRYSTLPYSDGLYIWNESMPTHMGDTIPGTNVAAVIEDLDNDGTITFPTVGTGLWPFGLARGSSLTSYPSLAFDASNTMYLSYSAIVEGLQSVADPDKLLRHEFIIKSCDEGMNWTAPYDVVPLSPGSEYEGIYGSIAKNVDGNVHMVYQRDFFAGNAIPGGTGPANPDEPGQANQGNDIIYVKVPVADLGNCPIPTGIKAVNSSVANLNFYPNPASTNGTVEVVLNENAKMELVVLNSVGQTVYASNVNGTIGANKINIDLSNLSSGLYFYQVKIADNKAITKKFAVEK
jgi:hypothetical protein